MSEMANKPLTKAQKLAILSKSIDAGAHIDINFHSGFDGTAPVNEIEKIFTEMKAETSAGSHENSRWIRFSNGDEIDFDGVLFLPQKVMPVEWQDTGDVEELVRS